jgi:FAD/FMN-containing dehydrogenase
MSDDYAGEAVRSAARSVHVPGDFAYDEALRTRSLAKDLRPAAVAFPDSLAEISSIVRAARDAGLRVAPLGAGHNPFPFGDLRRTVLLRTSRMANIKIYPDYVRLRAEAGAVWLPVTEEAGRHGMAALHGSSVGTGVVGHLLGGGLNWYGRRHGLAVNHVSAVELILADGTYVRTGADDEPELFWAVRGGGANFGVVTAVEFGLIELETAYAGMLVWDLSEAGRVLPRWLEWSAEAPDAVTTSYRHESFPVTGAVPEAFRGRRLVVIDGAVLGDDDEAERILAPLRELGPEMDRFGRIPAPAVRRIHMDPEQPTSEGGRAALLDELPSAAAFLEAVRDVHIKAELRQLGGALGRPADGGGALSHLDGAYQLITVGPVDECDRVVAALAEYSRGRVYLPFEHRNVDASAAYDEIAWKRLVELRALYDPAGVLQANHEIPLPGEAGHANLGAP